MKKDNKYFEKAYNFLEEVRNNFPPRTIEENMQLAEKLWAAWVQAIKGYKYWRTERGYLTIIGELYNKYPQLKREIKTYHILAQFLHAYGFYEGTHQLEQEDIENIEKGVKLIEKIIINERD